MLTNQPPKPRFVPLGPWNAPVPPLPVAPSDRRDDDLGRWTHAHQRTSSYVLVYLNPMLEMTATMMKMMTEMAVARP